MYIVSSMFCKNNAGFDLHDFCHMYNLFTCARGLCAYTIIFVTIQNIERVLTQVVMYIQYYVAYIYIYIYIYMSYVTDCDVIMVDVDTRELRVNAVKCIQLPMECGISTADCIKIFVSMHYVYPHLIWVNMEVLWLQEVLR